MENIIKWTGLITGNVDSSSSIYKFTQYASLMIISRSKGQW